MCAKVSFSVGDLVFAKLKGYRPWPAKIIDQKKSKKYFVYFYGTGEFGNVSDKNIFLYANTKSKFVTNDAMKRQNFKDAVDQIELALNGNDSAPKLDQVDQSRYSFIFDSSLNSTLDMTEFGGGSTIGNNVELTPQRPIKRKEPSKTPAPAAKTAKKMNESGAAVSGGSDMKQVLQNEVKLLQYNVDIISSLQRSSADAIRGISVLEKHKNLEVTALMLKKYPFVVETIERLRYYVGNTKGWNFSSEQLAQFNQNATKIRKLADDIYKNFMKLFVFPPNICFSQWFKDEVSTFQEQTKSLSHHEFVILTKDIQPAVNQNTKTEV